MSIYVYLDQQSCSSLIAPTQANRELLVGTGNSRITLITASYSSFSTWAFGAIMSLSSELVEFP